MNKKNTIIKNYFYNLSYEILILILPFITTPYLARVLASENIGIYSYTLSITTYFILIGSLGIAKYGQREISYLREDKKELSKTFFEIVILRFMTLLISGIIFYLTFANKGTYNIYYKIFLIEIFSTCIDISWFFQGLEEFKKVIRRNIIIKVISLICVFIFVKSKEDLWKYILIYVMSNFLGNLPLWFYLPQYISFSMNKLNVFKHFKFAFSLFIPQIAIKIYTVLDKTMLGNILNDIKEVGYYEEAQKLVKMLVTIVISLASIIAPRIALYYKKQKNQDIKKLLYTSLDYVYFLSIPMMFISISISNKFIPIFLGNDFNKAIILVNVMTPIILLIGLSNIIGIGFLVPTRQEKILTLSVTTGAITNVICNYLLIQKYGAIGASIATLIAESIVTLVQIYYIRDLIKIKSLIYKIKNYLVAGIIMLVFNYLIEQIIYESILNIALKVFFGIGIYVLILVVMKDEFLQLIISKLIRTNEKRNKSKV